LYSKATVMPTQPLEESDKKQRIRPISFGEQPGPEPHNASEVVAIDDSRFLFCDNNIGDGLFELRLAGDGSMACPLIRHPIRGIEPGSMDDLEGLTQATDGGSRFLFASPSFSLKRRKGRHRKKSRRGKPTDARSCLLRVRIGENTAPEAEVLSGFREWLVECAPELEKASRRLPDDDGLNVEGLAWSPADQALLLGVRSPVVDGRALVIRVRTRQIDGPWDLTNFELLPSVLLELPGDGEEQGIRAMEFDPSRGMFLIITGNATSAGEAPFRLLAWDGNEDGRVQHFDRVRFHRKMKVEGVTHGWIGGRGAVVFVDDAGGYQVLWDDDPRLKTTEVSAP
jgi:hypothetical protein